MFSRPDQSILGLPPVQATEWPSTIRIPPMMGDVGEVDEVGAAAAGKGGVVSPPDMLEEAPEAPEVLDSSEGTLSMLRDSLKNEL